MVRRSFDWIFPVKGPAMPKPVVIWTKKVVHEHISPLVRAVRTGRGEVEFEYLDREDAMGEETWLPLGRMPGAEFKIEVDSAVKGAFIQDASVLMAENPMIQKEK